jgi:hypothetical protein
MGRLLTQKDLPHIDLKGIAKSIAVCVSAQTLAFTADINTLGLNNIIQDLCKAE